MNYNTFLFDEYELSRWSYFYCLTIENDPTIRKNITNFHWAFIYCTNVEDDPELRKHIIGTIFFERRYREKTGKECKI